MARSPTLESLKLILKLLGQAELKGLEWVLPPALASFGCFPLLLLGTSLIISLDGYPFTVSFTSALASLSNVGPGLDLVGPTGNFSLLSSLSKLVMSLCMVIGRLEIFPILILFSREAWRHT